MEAADRYFQRNPVPEGLLFPSGIDIIVVIPVLDDPEVLEVITSLERCDRENIQVGVVIVVNHAENSAPDLKIRNRELAGRLREALAVRSSGICYQIMEAFDLPRKYAGVGLARKLGMDSAAAYFYRIGRSEYPVVSLDADTLVEKNYFREIVLYFARSKVAGVSIDYAHRLEEVMDRKEVFDAAVKYELYLRYYQMALRYTGHPHAYFCIGSAFAVRASDYVAQGGMNKRQAGEDFYFLQKLIATGRYTALHSTRVYPSPRFSERTPFGTGRSVRQIMEEGGVYKTYCPEAFTDLKVFFSEIGKLYRATEQDTRIYLARQAAGVRQFCTEQQVLQIIGEVRANCASEKQFVRRFFDNFNAFRVLKYLNYVHAGIYRKIDILQAARELGIILKTEISDSPVRMLEICREINFREEFRSE